MIAIALSVATTAQTSANTVAGTKVEDDSRSNDLKPTGCAAITLTANLSGSGTINGTTAAELISGSTAVDTISGADGNDCILGGNGKRQPERRRRD